MQRVFLCILCWVLKRPYLPAQPGFQIGGVASSIHMINLLLRWPSYKVGWVSFHCSKLRAPSNNRACSSGSSLPSLLVCFLYSFSRLSSLSSLGDSTPERMSPSHHRQPSDTSETTGNCFVAYQHIGTGICPIEKSCTLICKTPELYVEQIIRVLGFMLEVLCQLSHYTNLRSVFYILILQIRKLKRGKVRELSHPHTYWRQNWGLKAVLL